MALALTKSVVTKNVPILKCMKGRNVAVWAKKTPALTVSSSIKSREFSTHRTQNYFSWPRKIVKQAPVEIPKKCRTCQAAMPRCASCCTLATRKLNHRETPMQRSRSLSNPHVCSRACSSSKKGQQQPIGPGDICAMGPCNCPWPGGCPPPGFCQQAGCGPCAMGCGCCTPCPQCPPMPFPPNTQCPCCGGGQCQAVSPCVPCGACGACAAMPAGIPNMPPPPAASGMQSMGSYGTWGPMGAQMCPQGVPCPFPCPCHPGGQAGPGQQQDSKKKN